MDSCKTENLQVELEPRLLYLVAEWTHFTFFGIILPTIITHYKTKSVHLLGLMDSATMFKP